MAQFDRIVRRTHVAEQCDSRKHPHLVVGDLVNARHLGQRLDCELSERRLPDTRS